MQISTIYCITIFCSLPCLQSASLISITCFFVAISPASTFAIVTRKISRYNQSYNEKSLLHLLGSPSPSITPAPAPAPAPAQYVLLLLLNMCKKTSKGSEQMKKIPKKLFLGHGDLTPFMSKSSQI